MKELDHLKVERNLPFMAIFLVNAKCLKDISNLPNNWSKKQESLQSFLNVEAKPKKREKKWKQKKLPTKKSKDEVTE